MPWAPNTNLTGLGFWVEGDLSLNHSGSNVTSWSDQSGNSRNLDIVSATAPTYNATGLGGKPTASFVRASQTFLAHAANVVGATGDFMLALLARVDAAPNVDGTEAHIFDNISGTGGVGFGVNFFTPNSNEFIDLRPAGGETNDNSGTSSTYSIWRVYIVTRMANWGPQMYIGTTGAGNDCNAVDQLVDPIVTSWTDPGSGATANIAMGVRVTDAPASTAGNRDSTSYSDVTIAAALLCSNNNNSQIPSLFNYWNTKWALPPVITSAPTPQYVDRGATPTFSVTVDPLGGTPSYQWRKNGSNIGGATSSSYTTPAVMPADDAALYDCTITNLNGTTTTVPVATFLRPRPGVQPYKA